MVQYGVAGRLVLGTGNFGNEIAEISFRADVTGGSTTNE